jgi:YaiO family outer membrane protein
MKTRFGRAAALALGIGMTQGGALYADVAHAHALPKRCGSDTRHCRFSALLSLAEQRLAGGAADEALPLLESLYRQPHEDAYTAGRLLAKAYEATRQPVRAAGLYGELALRFPEDPDFLLQRFRIETVLALEAAHRLRLAGDAEGAIAAAQALYDADRSPYDAGLLIAQTEFERGDIASAQRLYETLAARFPSDADLARWADRLALRQSVDAARAALAANDTDRALVLLQTAYDAHPDSDEAGSLLATALAAHGQLQDAAAVAAALSRRFPDDPELSRQHTRFVERLTLRDAEALLGAGRASAALELLQPLYTSGTDRYAAGVLLARAHVILRQHTQAAAVYGALAARYPEDQDLATLQIAELVAAREAPAARTLYASLDEPARRGARQALGGTLRPLYPDSLTVTAGAANSSAPYPADSTLGIVVSHRLPRGALTFSAERDARFGTRASAYAVQYGFGLAQGMEGYVGGSVSPQHRFLAQHSFELGIGRYLPSGHAYLGLRHLDFGSSQATIVAPGYAFDAGTRLSIDTRLYWVPDTGAYSMMLAPQWTDSRGNRTTLTLTAGMASEQLGIAGGVLRAPSHSARFAQTWLLGDRFGLGGELFYEYRAGLYDRRGAALNAVYRW